METYCYACGSHRLLADELALLCPDCLEAWARIRALRAEPPPP